MYTKRIVAAFACLAMIAACGGEDASSPRAPTAVRAVSTSACSPLTYGGQDTPRFIVVLVGPLQNALSDHGIQNAQAMKLVMQQRGWRAGQDGVGVQVCDEASADSFTDAAKCRRNARLFAEAANVIAVIGPTTSGCAVAMLPTLGAARGGPVALVGTGNTYLGLTRLGPGVERGDPERLYPSGHRNYLRTVPADDAQAAAGVLIARQAHARRPFSVHDGSTYGRGLAGAFDQVARNIGGMTPAGTAGWNPTASGYTALAQRIRAARADAVYIGGILTNNGPRLIRDLRRHIGATVPIIASDGFNQPTALVEGAGSRAEDVMITLAAPPVRALPPEGQRWAAQFDRRWGAEPCCYAVHAAQATELVLDAISASDGSRVDVLRTLQHADVEGGLVGDFQFDRFGDSTLTGIAQYVIRDGRLEYVRMIDVPRRLLTRE